jgi:SAM-dependent methyltransferase
MTNTYAAHPLPACPICQQNTLYQTSHTCTDYLTKHTFTLLGCHACGCYITQGVLHSQSVDYYGKAYYNSKVGKFSPLIEKIFRWNHKRNARFFYKHFHPKTVLEIGCGRAYILRELKQWGVQVYCLESAGAAEWILQNKEVNVVSLLAEQEKAWPFEPEFFQLIVFWHVFEHLPDPIAALEQATQVLEKGKVLCISVPNATSLQAQLGLATWFHLDVPRHLFHFSKKGLIELLEKHDYEILKVTSGDAIQNLFGWFQSLANLFTPKATNTLYRFLQGGTPWRTAAKFPLLIQILTSIIWIPIGLLGYVIEEITGRYGTVTVFAKKK